MRTIILTGVNSFIGSHLVQILTKYYHVRCLVRADSKREYRSGIEYVEIDFKNPMFKNSLFKDVFSVVHILSLTDPYHPDIQIVNVEFTRMLVEASVTNRVQKFVYLSSETVELPGQDLYTRSKKLAEDEVAKTKNHLILRPTVVYGEGDRSNIGLLTKLIKYLPIVPIIGSGTQLMQPIYVNDVAMCIVSGLRNNIAGIHLIAGHKSLQYIEIVNIIVKALGKKRVIFRVPFGMVYAMVRLFEVTRLPFLRKSQVDNLRIDKEYSVTQTERRFNLTFSNPREEINRIVK